MALRAIQDLMPAQPIDMGGVPILQPLPGRGIQQIDPFLLIHHWRQDFPGGNHPSRVGVGPHPHRGFAPVTFIYSGDIHHRDSEGNDAIVGGGGTQWMYAGSGLTHSERPSAAMAQHGGTLELIQFWVNVPAAHKMDPPAYYPLQQENTPQGRSDDGLVTFSVASGQLLGIEGPVPTHRPLTTAQLHIEAGGTITYDIPENQNTILYLLDGAVDVNGTEVTDKTLVRFAREAGETITLRGIRNAKAMLLSGVPLNEPVASYGPFVMNTSREIMQALEDAQAGRMGALTESFGDA